MEREPGHPMQKTVHAFLSDPTSADRYRELVERFGDGLWIRDSEHRIQYADRDVVALLGRDRGDVIGTSIDAFQTDGSVRQLRTIIQKLKSEVSNREHLRQFELVRPDGSTQLCEERLTVVMNDAGEHTETDGSIRAVGDHPERQPGVSAPIEESYCRKTIVQEGLLAEHDAPRPGS